MRRHHGLLVAALPAPLGRMVLLSHLRERVRLPDRTVGVLSSEGQLLRRRLSLFTKGGKGGKGGKAEEPS